jgi:neurofilament medium polypeptide (neurofilament 3)
LVSETYPPVAEGEPIRLIISGGQTKQIRIKSANSTIWEWTGRIFVPAKDDQCKKTIQLTDTRKPTLTIPATTSIVSDPTLTPVIPITKTPTPIVPFTKTYTPAIPFTKTYTPIIPPTKTYTPIVPPTKTYTPVIPPTKTYTPTPKNPKECQDGKDNDGDKLIDYPADPQCTGPTDNKESH